MSLTIPNKSVAWYIKDENLPPLHESVQEFFTQYSSMPADQVQPHILHMRDRAWNIFPFPCIGQLRFLDFPLAQLPSYSQVLSRLKADPTARLVDVGCGLASDLRKLALDGVDPQQLVALDIRSEFLDLSYELFCDRGSFDASFVVDDVLAPRTEEREKGMQSLEGQMMFVHAASFLHLFGWDDQLRACTALARLLRREAGAMILGRFVGSVEPGEYPHATNPSGVMYSHDEETFQKLWRAVAGRMGDGEQAEWSAKASFHDPKVHSASSRANWKGSKFLVMRFEIVRL